MVKLSVAAPEDNLPNIRTARRQDAMKLSVIAEEPFRDTFSAVNTREDMDLHCRNAT